MYILRRLRHSVELFRREITFILLPKDVKPVLIPVYAGVRMTPRAQRYVFIRIDQ